MSINSVSAVSDALKYINGAEVSSQQTSIVEDVESSVFNPLTAVFGLSEVNSTLKKTLGTSNLKDTFLAIKNGAEAGTRSTSISEQFKNTLNTIYEKAESTDAAKKAASTAESAASSSGIFSKIKGIFGSAKNAVTSGVSKVTSAIADTSLGKTVSGALSKFGETTVGSALKSAGSKAGKILKGTGAAGIMIFEGFMGLVTEVIPAFAQGGFKSGMKQLGKTSINVLGSGLGWAAGYTAATAIGAAIGSVFPGVGTIIGGAIGTFVGGIVGSTIGSGVAKKITGDSELEILEDEQYDKTAEQVMADSSAMEELEAYVEQQVEYEIASGTADEDTEIMAAYLNSGVFGTTSTTTASDTTPTTSTTPAVTTDWSSEAEQIANGDTSLYNISDERLDAVFDDSSSIASTSDTYTADEEINYFAIDA